MPPRTRRHAARGGSQQGPRLYRSSLHLSRPKNNKNILCVSIAAFVFKHARENVCMISLSGTDKFSFARTVFCSALSRVARSGPLETNPPIRESNVKLCYLLGLHGNSRCAISPLVLKRFHDVLYFPPPALGLALVGAHYCPRMELPIPQYVY